MWIFLSNFTPDSLIIRGTKVNQEVTLEITVRCKPLIMNGI